MNLHNSIRVRLIAAFLGLATSPILIVGLFFIYKAYSVQIQDAIVLQREMSKNLTSRTQSLIRALEDELKLLINIKDLYKLGAKQQKLILSIFHSRQSAIDDLILLDANGRVISFHSRLKLQQNLLKKSLKNLELFTVPMAFKKTYFGPVRFQESTGEPLMLLSVPIINLRTGEPKGVLVAEIRLKEIWDLVASIRPGKKGDSYLVDANNRVVAHSNPSVVLRGTHFHPPKFEGLQIGLNNHKSVLVSRLIKLGNRYFYVVTENPTSEALSMAIDTVRILVVVVILTLLLSGGLGFLLVRCIVRPIEDIAETARAVNNGDLSCRVQIKSHDEIGVLASTFNKMTIQLESLINDLENRVAERTADLASSNKDLEAFAYSVSHDLRAPLRHIDGFLELLMQKMGTTLDPQAVHYINTISNSAKKMGLLIDNLLTFSRMGLNVMSFRQINMQTLSMGIIQELEPETINRNIQWKIGDLPGISGDPAMLRIVMTNLISNAIKFTQSKEQAIIEIGSKYQESTTIIFVSDNGVGFKMEYADKIFGVFQRLHRQDEFEGTGIGLANVYRIIKRHGGRIWAESEVDIGTTFYFTIPSKNSGEP